MKLTGYIPILLAVFGASCMAQPSELAAGKASYRDGEFQQAVTHLQRAIRSDPQDAACHYWIGRSYETLADIAAPFGAKYRTLARASLTKAMELAPDRPEYRRELFDFLLDSVNFSRGEQQQAAGILLGSAESDPEYEALVSRFEEAQKVNSSVNARLGRLFLAAPQTAVRLVTAGR
jgi:tetratricopeptide (TPR) repeat protein